MQKISILASQAPKAVCMFCGYVMDRCECSRCAICGSRRHTAVECPEKPGDAVDVIVVPRAA